MGKIRSWESILNYWKTWQNVYVQIDYCNPSTGGNQEHGM